MIDSVGNVAVFICHFMYCCYCLLEVLVDIIQLQSLEPRPWPQNFPSCRCPFMEFMFYAISHPKMFDKPLLK